VKGHLGWELGGSKVLVWGPKGGVQGDRDPTPWCQPPSSSEYHERVRSQGQQLQQLQAELDKLNKEVSSVRAVHSEVSPARMCTSPSLGAPWKSQEIRSWDSTSTPGPY
jgi:hypothetical protein